MNSYVTVEITGKDVKRFIKSLYKRNIRFYSLDVTKKEAIATISFQDYLKIKEIKTIYKVRVINYRGFIKLRQLFSIYKIFVLSLLLGIFLLYMLTNTIFEIEVVHDKQEMRTFIEEQLEEYGIKRYKFVKSFKENEKIVNEIISSNKDKIEWLELERIGCKYIARVTVRKVKEEDEVNTPRDIIAKKKGMITSITASKGEVVKKINDYVNIGDVIISGTIKNKDTIKDYVRANGKVFAEVWYHAKVEIPYSYQETTLTGKKKKVFSFRFLNKDIRPFSNFKTKEDNIIFSLYNPLIPISISLIEEKETNIEDSIYSEEVALIKAQDIAREKLKSNLGKDDVIIYEKYLKNREEDSKIIVDMFFKVNEDITGYMEIIPNIEEEKE